MQIFIPPKDSTKFIQWLLQISITHNWTNLLEYSEREIYQFIIKNAGEIDLPLTAQRNYDDKSILTALVNPNVNNDFLNLILGKCSALSIHDEKEMIFLVADDFDKDCFPAQQSSMKGIIQI